MQQIMVTTTPKRTEGEAFVGSWAGSKGESKNPRPAWRESALLPAHHPTRAGAVTGEEAVNLGGVFQIDAK